MVRANNKHRCFDVLESLHVLPNVTYLAKVRNTDEKDEKWEKEGANYEYIKAHESHEDKSGHETKEEH